MNLADKLLGPNADLAALMDELLGLLPGQGDGGAHVDREIWDRALLDPARDIMRRSGKGLRARLLERSWRIAGGDGAPPDMLPVLIELLHLGSLVIDDIEDDSPSRRGEPTLHRRFGVPVALNTGNWLYFLPLAALSRTGLDDSLRLSLYEDVVNALLRCHQGQALDLAVDVATMPQPDIPSLVLRSTRLKTGALMQLSARLGARAAGAGHDGVVSLGRFGRDVGVGLQMLDDWSGICVPDRHHKGVEDLVLARPTWIWAWLAQDLSADEFADVVKQLRGVGGGDDPAALIARIRAIVDTSGRARVHECLSAAFRDLGEVWGDSPHIEALRGDLAELEVAYG